MSLKEDVDGASTVHRIMWTEFFCRPGWLYWSWPGMMIMGAVTWYQVHLDVVINAWFGDFYDLIQKALSEEANVSQHEIYGYLFTFSEVAGTYIVVAVMSVFFTKHWTFRWRQAMNDYYMSHWQELRHIEGASQRVQEETRILVHCGLWFAKCWMRAIGEDFTCPFGQGPRMRRHSF